MNPLTEETIDVDGSPLNVAVGPENGPPLILLHGVLRRWQDWWSMIPALATRWQVFALDFRGHGMSSPRPGRYRVIDYCEDAVALLRHCHDRTGRRAAIFGHSLGGMVALATATGPGAEMCRAVISEDPPFETMGSRIGKTPLLDYFGQLRPFAGSDRPLAELARELGEVAMGPPDTGQRRPLREMRDAVSIRFSAHCLADVDPDVLEPIVAGDWLEHYAEAVDFGEVAPPVLLMQADHGSGGMLRDEDVSRLGDRLPDVTNVRLRGASHLMHWENAPEVLRWVCPFLEMVRGEG